MGRRLADDKVPVSQTASEHAVSVNFGVTPTGGYHNDSRDPNFNGGNSNLQARNDNRSNLGSSRMSGDGRTNREESTRGHASMARQRPQQHQVTQHAPVEHHASGGGGRRR